MPLPRGLYSKRGWWYYQPPQINGYRPSAIALRTNNLTTALSTYRELLAAGTTLRTGLPLSIALERFLEEATRTGRHTTLLNALNMRSTIRSAARVIGDLPIDLLSPQHAHQLLAAFRASRRAPSTVGRLWRHLRTLTAWMKSSGLLAADPFQSISTPQPHASRAAQYLPAATRDDMIAAAPDSDLRTILVLGFHCGLRIREILAAPPAWIHLSPDRGALTVSSTAAFRPKNKRTRTVPLNRTARAHLLTLDTRGPFLVAPGHLPAPGREHRLRWNPIWRAKRLAAACGAPSFSWHTMRHTFGALHAQAGTSLYKIARWLGDTMEVTATHYAALSPEDSDIERTA